jgi:hypothetical protein
MAQKKRHKGHVPLDIAEKLPSDSLNPSEAITENK